MEGMVHEEEHGIVNHLQLRTSDSRATQVDLQAPRYRFFDQIVDFLLHPALLNLQFVGLILTEPSPDHHDHCKTVQEES